jgi:hypothetical protein
VPGGQNNTASGDTATVGGGRGNSATAANSVVAGGDGNQATHPVSTVAGGGGNLADAERATVGGGAYNRAIAFGATVPGGQNNLASGQYSFAAGYQAKATQEGAFVWADFASLEYDPFAYPRPGGITNSFNVRAQGGVYFATAIDDIGLPTAGVYVSRGGSGWNTYCDRNAKTRFSDVDARDVLDRLASVPIKAWNYRTQDPSVRHLGPMAQDFNAAFGTGEPDKAGEKKYINSLDADGVALAAIQGLNQKLEAAVKEKDARIAELEQRLTALEQIVKTQSK